MLRIASNVDLAVPPNIVEMSVRVVISVLISLLLSGVLTDAVRVIL